jgi:ankyrin repeat protein
MPKVTMQMVRSETSANKKLALLKQVEDVNELGEQAITNLAALAPSIQLLKIALEKGADINQRTPAKYNSQTALMQIAGSMTGRDPAYPKALELLLAAKPDLDATDGEGSTALYHAILKENLKLAKLLIAAGADPNVPNTDGNSILEDLMTWGRLNDASAAKLIKVLLESKKWKDDVLQRAVKAATAKGWPTSTKLIAKARLA